MSENTDSTTTAETLRFRARMTSPYCNDEVELTILPDGLMASATFDTVILTFIDIESIRLADYEVIVQNADGEHRFSHLGNFCQGFFDSLCEAFNTAVLRALFIEGEPLITALGEYSLTEDSISAHGSGPFQVHRDSVVILPPNLDARRIPLCFMVGLEKADFRLTLRLDSGESYALARLGYESENFAQTIETQIELLREQGATTTRRIDPTLTTIQSTQLARMLQQGRAASVETMTQQAPSFIHAVETLLDETPAAETYPIFKELCDPVQIHIGFFESDNNKEDAFFGRSGSERPSLAALTFWLVVPSPDRRFAAVEFAEKDMATFVYSTDGDFAAFVSKLNRALEAISFRREVIRLTDEELLKPQYQHYRFSIKRLKPLRFVRSQLVGRVIHSNPEAWRRRLLELWA